MNQEVTVSFGILMLNDLLRMNVIDRNLYEMAVKELESTEASSGSVPEHLPATA